MLLKMIFLVMEPKVYHQCHSNSQLCPVQSQLNPVHIFEIYFSETHISITPIHMLFSEISSAMSYMNKNVIWFLFSSACCMPSHLVF
jgi:hypothetical protein